MVLMALPGCRRGNLPEGSAAKGWNNRARHWIYCPITITHAAGCAPQASINDMFPASFAHGDVSDDLTSLLANTACEMATASKSCFH